MVQINCIHLINEYRDLIWLLRSVTKGNIFVAVQNFTSVCKSSMALDFIQSKLFLHPPSGIVIFGGERQATHYKLISVVFRFCLFCTRVSNLHHKLLVLMSFI